MARHGQAHERWPRAQGSDEDAQGPHRIQEEAHAGQEGAVSPAQGGLQGEEGVIQAVPLGIATGDDSCLKLFH